MSERLAEWRPVDGWPGYEVSDDGQVRSIRHKQYPKTGVPLILKHSIVLGYHVVSLNYHGLKRQVKVHRLVALAFLGPEPDGKQVCHRNGDKDNNRLSNLYYGTSVDNNRDTVKHGRNRNAAKVACDNGHEFTDANTRVNRSGSRSCRRCHAEWERERRALARSHSRHRHASELAV